MIELFAALSRPAGRQLHSRIVSALGANLKLLVLFRLGLYADLAEAAAGSRIRGLVSDCVLIADVVGYLPADFVHFVQGLGKKREASGALSDDLQRPLGPLGVFLIPQDSDRVHRWAVLLLQLLHRILKALSAGVIFSVGHYDQHCSLQ